MRQQTFAEGTFELHSKTTRRAAFLAEMERVVPWAALCAVIEPFYPKGEGGRPTVGLERMLRVYFLQQWFNLSDPAVEEALYDSVSMRRFVGVDLGRERAPDETTACRFRHLLEKHDLGKKLFEEVHRHLEAQGLKVSTGTIVDATIIAAPPSTKNKDRARDPDMRQTQKSGQWYFGMKAHMGVSTARPRSSMPWSPPPPTWRTRRCCPISCMGARHGCGAIRHIAGKPRSSNGTPRRRATSPTGVTATWAWSMRWSVPRTAPSPACAPRSSTLSA